MKIKRIIFKFFLNNLPKNKFFDNLLSFIQFIFIHKRLPTKKKIFNDVLYDIKTSNEIDNPLRIYVSDKEHCKIFLNNVIEKKYIIPNLHIIEKLSEIDKLILDSNCIIKPTHLAGKWLIKKKNQQLNNINIKDIKSWFIQNQYFANRERNYLNLKPKIIIEPLLFDDDNIIDYKIFCYKGSARAIQVDFNRANDHSRSIYDIKWNKIDISIDFKMNEKKLEKPNNLNEMINIAEKISKYFNFIRIDMYTNNKEIFVGEITNIHGGATEKFLPSGYFSEIQFSKILFYEK